MTISYHKRPDGWGLTAYLGRVELICDSCKKPLVFRDQYLYQYTPEGPIVLHNDSKCYEGYIPA